MLSNLTRITHTHTHTHTQSNNQKTNACKVQSATHAREVIGRLVQHGVDGGAEGRGERVGEQRLSVVLVCVFWVFVVCGGW
jgi:hypothetical protein